MPATNTNGAAAGDETPGRPPLKSPYNRGESEGQRLDRLERAAKVAAKLRADEQREAEAFRRRVESFERQGLSHDDAVRAASSRRLR